MTREQVTADLIAAYGPHRRDVAPGALEELLGVVAQLTEAELGGFGGATLQCVTAQARRELRYQRPWPQTA